MLEVFSSKLVGVYLRMMQVLEAVLLKVVCQHLTPPLSSTNVERLFSNGGLTATNLCMLSHDASKNDK